MSMKVENENIKREMLNRDTREKNYEMIDVSNLEDDTRNQRRYIRGRSEKGKMLTEKQLKYEIENRLRDLAKKLNRGSHIEIHPAKEGIRVFAVDKEILK